MYTSIERLQSLIPVSGDSKFLGYSYSNEILKYGLELYEGSEKIEIAVKTKIVRSNLPKQVENMFYTCYLDLIDLEAELSQQFGYYVPNKDFGKMKSEVRKGVSLAYGEKYDSVKWCLNIVGYDVLLSCLISA